MIRWFSIIAIALLLNSVYLSALPSATIFYMANVLLHLALGAGFLVLLRLRGWMRPGLPIFLSVLPALYLIRYGAIRDHRMWLWAHIALAVAGAVTLWLHARKHQPQLARWMFLSLVLLAVVPGGVKLLEKPSLVANASETPSSMEEEGDGPKSPFWPSSAKTNVGLVPSSYFLDSEQCGTCHKDIYEQWKSSVHHFASFNNQFYRKSIEFMQEKQGSTKPSRWCAACHDHAVIFNGKVGNADQGSNQNARSASGLGLCVLPLDRARQRHNGQCRLYAGIQLAARHRRQSQSLRAIVRQIPDLSQSAPSPADISEAVAPDSGVLFVLPQGCILMFP